MKQQNNFRRLLTLCVVSIVAIGLALVWRASFFASKKAVKSASLTTEEPTPPVRSSVAVPPPPEADFLRKPAPAAPAAPAPPSLSPQGKAKLKQGMEALQAGRTSAAIQEFEQVVKSDPSVPIARAYLGLAYVREKRLSEALKQFQEEGKLLPNPAFSWAHIADVYYAQGNLPAAIKSLEKAVELQPDLAQAYFNLGMLYPQATQLGKGVDALKRCIALEPGNHYAHFLLGNQLYKLTRLDEAEQVLQEAIRLQPQNGTYHYGLAQVYLRRTVSPETTERARVELQRALELGAAEPAAVHYNLGLCYQRQGEWEKARQELETSVKMAPEAWSAFYALQEVLTKLGRAEEARKARVRFADLRAKEDERMKRSFYEQEVGRNPENADTRCQYAEYLAQKGDYRGARAALAKTRQLAKKHRADANLQARIAALETQLQRAPNP